MARLKAVGASDLPRLALLLVEAFRYYGDPDPLPLQAVEAKLRQRFGANPGFEALLVERGETALGFAIFAPVFWTSDCEIALFLKEIFVVEEARGQGLGRRMMAALGALAMARGWTRIVWTVDRRNRRALRFYASLPSAREVGKDLYILSGAGLTKLAAEEAGRERG